VTGLPHPSDVVPPQLLRQGAGFGRQQVSPVQISGQAQLPQNPPQPSSPQVLPVQSGAQAQAPSMQRSFPVQAETSLHPLPSSLHCGVQSSMGGQ
jgi:hypothetical protein